MKNEIYFFECAYNGMLVVYGSIGKRCYMGYSKKEALKRYRNEKA